MKRIRITEVIQAPTEAQSAGPSTLFDPAAPNTANHPALVCFAPGSAPRPGTEKRLKINVTHHSESGAVQLHAADTAGKGSKWVSKMSPASEYMCAIVDKEKGTARIVEVSGEYCLNRSVEDVRHGVADEGKVEDKRTYVEKRGDLLEGFGGKRAKDMYAKMERNAITGERISNAAAAELDTAITSHKDAMASAGNHGTYGAVVPPHRADATRVEEAYPLLGLLSGEEFSFFQGKAKELIEHAAAYSDLSQVENPGWHAFCWSLMIRACKPPDDNADGDSMDVRCNRVVAAMYLHCLIVLVGCESKRIGRRERVNLRVKMDVPSEVLDVFLSSFTDKGEGDLHTDWFKSKDPTAKTLYYAMVMWLTATSFTARTGADELAAALQVKVEMLLIHIKHLGGEVKKNKGSDREASKYKVELSVPLKFPSFSRGRGTPRKRR